MTISEKNELLDNMSICYNRINYLKIISEEKNQPDMTAQLERRKNRLKIEIDGLLRDLYATWIGDAAQLENKLTNTNKELNSCIAEIEKDINFAQNIVKALGYVDDVIKVAADLVP
ncbi:MAG: hypothetical protein WA240_11145 [Nitrospirota bacterium]